jgi:hypothetical protein
MNKINPLIFKNRVNVEFLPTEPIFGLKLINCKVLCEDDKYRQVIGIEVGFIFFTISYANMHNSN